MAFDTIQVEREGTTGIITLNRPKVLNALSDQVFAELGEALSELSKDGSTRVIIITGSGTRAFAAGADIGELEAMSSAQEGYQHSRRAHRLLREMQELPQAIIMAVNGFALGGGNELAMAGDIILAAESAKFGQPETKLGIIPGFGGTQRLPRLVGRVKGLEMIFVGEPIGAEEAHRLGLVNQVVPDDRLMSTAKQMARAIAERAPQAIALAKRAVYEGLEAGEEGGNALETTYFGLAIGSEDRVEGTKAFLEKRPPRWTGT
ncbi:MAG: enoyl-CoA hydratase/isomerase family protein [Chloroflexota bacterium]